MYCFDGAAVSNLRSEDYNLLIKSQLIGAPIGYWIGEQQQCSSRSSTDVDVMDT